jgi:hypothetical protein
MKKIYLFIAVFVAVCGSLMAQADVTSDFLQNPGFDLNINHSATETAVNVAVDAPAPGTFEAVSGWTVVPSFIGNSASSSFEFGSESKVNNTLPPASDKNGNAVGGVLGFSVAWTGFVTYYQTVYLPEGIYSIESNAYNNGTNALAHSRIGWVPETGAQTLSAKTSYALTTWETETVNFTITGSAKGKIQVGVASTNAGSGSHGRIFFDNIKLICTSFVNTVAAKITEANTLVGSETDDAAVVLNNAIAQAQLVADAGASATLKEVSDALAALDNAMTVYKIAVASPANPVNMTSYIKNASFEHLQLDKQQTIPYWTKTGTANTEYCTRNDAGSAGFKTGNVYFQYWNSAKPDYSISQVVTGLINGKYLVIADAGGDAGTTGTYVYAGDNQTQVTSTGEHSVEAIVVNGSLTLGFKSVSRTVNWSFADNFRLYYLGEVQDPVLTLSAANLFLSENVKTKTFVVTGLNLTEDVVIEASAGSGLSVSLENIAKDATGIDTGIEITVTYNPALVSEATVDGSISVVSGTITKTVAVKSFKNPTPTNLLGLAMGNGHTGAGSEPDTFGWAYSGAVVWTEAAGDNYANRFRDGLYASRVLTFNRNTEVLSYPVTLEAGKSYKFSCNTTHINAGPLNTTFALNSLPDATGDFLESETQNVARWNGESTLVNFTFGFTVQVAGTYYMVWTTDNSTERTAVGDLMLQEAYAVAFNTNGGNDIDAQYVVSGDKVTAPETPVKGSTDFLGWYSDVELTTLWDIESDVVNGNITLFAKWDTSTGLNFGTEKDEPLSTEYFSLQGQMVKRPVEGGVYLVKKTYTSQKTEVVKVVYRKQQN